MGAMSTEQNRVSHPFDPIFDERSRVLILGTMPSPKSRETGFYYGHPQNRFWRVLAELFDEPPATTVERKRAMLLRHHIALWDVLATCDIAGASDASIAGEQPNDLSVVLDAAPIEAVFCTGAKAAELYAAHCEAKTGLACVKLPSTSPANAQAKLDDLVQAYRAMIPHLHEPDPAVLDVSRVVALEQAIAEDGTSLAELMDRAGQALAWRVHALRPDARIVVLCGNGNNGGDGWVAARDLIAFGHDVAIACVKEPHELRAQPARDVSCALLPALEHAGATIAHNPSARQIGDLIGEADVIVDALLGTGFSGNAVKEPFDEWIRLANERREGAAITVSADVPSGLNAQTGEASDPCITADATVTMITSKMGLHAKCGPALCGQVHVAPIAYVEPYL